VAAGNAEPLESISPTFACFSSPERPHERAVESAERPNEADLATPGTIFQIGVPPVRVDVITAIDGVEFGDAWPERVEATLGGLSVPVLSRQHLVQNKRAADRPQDRADVDWLENNPPSPDAQ
jgi:hypothetical protein